MFRSVRWTRVAFAALSMSAAGLGHAKVGAMPIQLGGRLVPPVLTASDIANGGLPLYCILMRGDGSQFTISLVARASDDNTLGAYPATVLIKGNAADISSGTYPGTLRDPYRSAHVELAAKERWEFTLDRSSDHAETALLVDRQYDSEARKTQYKVGVVKSNLDNAFSVSSGYCFDSLAVPAFSGKGRS